MTQSAKKAGNMVREVKAYHGDCIKLLSQHGPYDFIFADPPFNIDRDYDGFKDKIDDAKYYTWTHQWMKECWYNLKGTGVLALHGNDNLAEIYLGLPIIRKHRIAWVNWHYRFGQCNRNNWIDSRCHCLIYAKSGGVPRLDYAWNPDDVLVDSDRATVYNDNRCKKTNEDGSPNDNYDGGGQRLPGAIWGIPSDGPYWGRVSGNNKERRPKHNNQLPEVYLERLIRAYTNKGDHVCDPFGGSGTAAVVCQSLDRSCVTFDVSANSVNSIRKRLKQGTIRIK